MFNVASALFFITVPFELKILPVFSSLESVISKLPLFTIVFSFPTVIVYPAKSKTILFPLLISRDGILSIIVTFAKTVNVSVSCVFTNASFKELYFSPVDFTITIAFCFNIATSFPCATSKSWLSPFLYFVTS